MVTLSDYCRTHITLVLQANEAMLARFSAHFEKGVLLRAIEQSHPNPLLDILKLKGHWKIPLTTSTSDILQYFSIDKLQDGIFIGYCALCKQWTVDDDEGNVDNDKKKTNTCPKCGSMGHYTGLSRGAKMIQASAPPPSGFAYWQCTSCAYIKRIDDTLDNIIKNNFTTRPRPCFFLQ